MTWRMDKPCDNCPFNASGPGLKLRRSLTKRRWASILGGLLRREHFVCHKTSDETGNGTNLICAGSIAWAEARGLSSQLQQMCERWDAVKSKATTTASKSSAK